MTLQAVKQIKVKKALSNLSEGWLKRVSHITNRYDRSFINQLGQFCSGLGIEPSHVSDVILDDFERYSHTENRTLSRAKQLRRDVSKAWNRVSASTPDWPQTTLTLVDRRPQASVSTSDLPRSFGDDLDRFVHRSGRRGLFDSSILKPLSSVSRYDRRNKILLMTTILIQSGVPNDAIKCLADLVTPSARRAILGSLWERSGEMANAHFYNLARILTQIAKHWAQVSDDELALFKAAEANLRPEKAGMTPKNEARLRTLTNRANTQKIVSLAHRIIKEFDHRNPTARHAVEVQSAIAIAILLIAPIREKNLAELNIDENFHRVRDDEWFLIIPWGDVKNKQDLTFPVPRVIIDLIKIYLDIYRPILLKRPSKRLFISINGNPKTPAQIGAQLPKFIERHTGLVMNVHLFRHFAAYLYLKANPGHYEPVRQLLAHKDLVTTTRFYTKLEQVEAFRQYDAVIDNYRKGAPDGP